MQPTIGFENSSLQTQCVRSNRSPQISLGCSSGKRLLRAIERTVRCNRFPHRLLGHEPNLQIRMVARVDLRGVVFKAHLEDLRQSMRPRKSRNGFGNISPDRYRENALVVVYSRIDGNPSLARLRKDCSCQPSIESQNLVDPRSVEHAMRVELLVGLDVMCSFRG